jgi:uncharacterized protein (TIGR02466 family)
MLKAEKIEMLPLFPTFVWKTELTPEAYAPINREIRKKLAEFMGGEIRIDNRQSFQTAQDLYRYPEFGRLIGLIRSALGGVFEYLKFDADSAAITGCWANVNGVGARHRPHTHPNNLLSGVYYVNTASGSDKITFDDPRAQNYVIYPRFKEATIENSAEINLTVREGTLLVFPAWLQHRVGSNESNSERISVSFNAMVSIQAAAKSEGLNAVTRIRD